MKIAIQNNPYRIINLVLVCIILAVLAYSFIFGSPGRPYPVPSGSELLTGQPSISTGMSRSFSAIMHFDLIKAKAFNQYGIRIFSFFLFQLILRTAAIFLAGHQERKTIIITDCITSVTMFIVLFWPFIIGVIAATPV